jgi:hypothetical protein
MPAPGGSYVLKLKHHQAGWLPVALEDDQLAAADEVAAASRPFRSRRRQAWWDSTLGDLERRSDRARTRRPRISQRETLLITQ